jgi:hypothetical protein
MVVGERAFGFVLGLAVWNFMGGTDIITQLYSRLAGTRHTAHDIWAEHGV